MQDVTQLHHDAMELADAADVAQRHGQSERAADLNRQAFEKEREAANTIAGRDDLEPTRSILHRSAASLALMCNDIPEAERLITSALSTGPPAEIAEELRDLLENVYFHRHLKLRGIVLHPNEFQLSFTGAAVGFGIAPTDQVITRVHDVETLIYRTAERHLNREFRERGRRKKSLSQDMELYVSVPRAASFAITFRIGTEQLKLPGMDLSREVIDDLLDCFDLLNRGDVDTLKERIPDDSYFRNFVGLAKKIAPDGEQIQSVGFTAPNAQEERTVTLTTPKANITAVAPEDRKAPTRTRTEVRGTLLEADATSRASGRIEIVDASGHRHRVRVPRGMMSDIVKPMFEEEVIVTGVQEDKDIVLDTIDLAETDNAG